jgi:hypothetical protein
MEGGKDANAPEAGWGNFQSGRFRGGARAKGGWLWKTEGLGRQQSGIPSGAIPDGIPLSRTRRGTVEKILEFSQPEWRSMEEQLLGILQQFNRKRLGNYTCSWTATEV